MDVAYLVAIPARPCALDRHAVVNDRGRKINSTRSQALRQHAIPHRAIPLRQVPPLRDEILIVVNCRSENHTVLIEDGHAKRRYAGSDVRLDLYLRNLGLRHLLVVLDNTSLISPTKRDSILDETSLSFRVDRAGEKPDRRALRSEHKNRLKRINHTRRKCMRTRPYLTHQIVPILLPGERGKIGNLSTYPKNRAVTRCVNPRFIERV